MSQAGGVKDAVRDLPAEGGEMDDGTPDDMAAVQAAQSAVQAEAAAEVRAAVAKARHEASADYAAAKSGFMAQEAQESFPADCRPCRVQVRYFIPQYTLYL